MVDLKRYVPRYFEESPEMNVIMETEEKLLDETLMLEISNTKANQFIITATESGIQAFEYIIGVVANPATESLDFRRQRLLNRFALRVPLTARMLRNRLDSIIGVGKYTLTIDYANHTMTLESSAQNQDWFNEIYITILDVKPANMVFINKPLFIETIKLNEVITMNKIDYNYRVGTTAKISLTTPLASRQDMGIIKGGGIMSVQPAALQATAQMFATNINQVIINDRYEMTVFDSKTATNGKALLEYTIPISSNETVITSVKLMNGTDTYFKYNSYIPLTTDQTLKHEITVIEGV